jgi:hypothetical protein
MRPTLPAALRNHHFLRSEFAACGITALTLNKLLARPL